MTAKEPLANTPDQNKALEDLTTIPNDQIPKIQERDFKEKWLPLLADTSGEVDLRPWIENVAGHTFMFVDVYNGGEFLFRVPPLQRTLPTSAKRRRGNSIDEIVVTAEQKNLMSPRLGLQFMEQNLNRRVTARGPLMKDMRAWDEILKRYGYPPIFGEELTQGKQDGEDPDEVFSGEFDEL